VTVCRRCLREYDEPEGSTTPVEELGRIFLEDISGYYTGQLCPDCREQLGMFTLLWFGK